MTFLVPYDDSPLSKAALTRARLYAVALEHAPASVRKAALRDHPLEVIAMAVVPESARYAGEKGWIDPEEPFDARTVFERLHAEVLEIDPGAEFIHERVAADRQSDVHIVRHRLPPETHERLRSAFFPVD